MRDNRGEIDMRSANLSAFVGFCFLRMLSSQLSPVQHLEEKKPWVARDRSESRYVMIVYDADCYMSNRA